MRKLLSLFIVMLSCGGFAATNVRVSGQSVYATVDPGQAWSNFAGSNAFNYTLDVPSSSVGACVLIVNNNPTNSRAVTVAAYISPYPYSTTLFTGGNPFYVFEESNTYTIPASQGQTHFYRVFGGAHWALNLANESGTAGGSPDTASIYVSYSPTCPQGAQSLSAGANAPSLVAPVNQSVALSVPTNVNLQASVTVPANNQNHTINCFGASVVQEASGTPSAQALTAQIQTGTSCAAGTTVWSKRMGVPATLGASSALEVCGLQIPVGEGTAFTACFSSAASTAFEDISVAYYDQ